MQVYLIGQEAGRHFTCEITKAELVIGRDPRCDLVTQEPKASRRHAAIVRREEGFFLQDLKSRNGTRLNGKKVDGPAKLTWGDRITIGDLSLLFVYRAADRPPEGGAPPAEPKTVGVNVADFDLSVVRGARPAHLNLLHDLSVALQTVRSPEEARSALLDHALSRLGATRAALLACGAGPDEILRRWDRFSSESYRSEIEFDADLLRLARAAKRAFLRQDTFCSMYVPVLRGDAIPFLLYLDSAGQSRTFEETDLRLLHAATQQFVAALDRLEGTPQPVPDSREGPLGEAEAVEQLENLEKIEAEKQELAVEKERLREERMKLEAQAKALTEERGRIAEERAALIADRSELEEAQAALAEERKELATTGSTREEEPCFAGESEAAVRIRDQINRLAGTDDVVFVRGEPGTGRSFVARRLHRIGRPGTPWVRLHLGTFEPERFEQELFGGEGQPGSFAAAGRGTLFLAGIRYLPTALQGRIGKVIGEGRLPSGDVKAGAFPRIVIGVDDDLPGMVAANKIREAMGKKKHVEILLPPLRDRVEDIEPLAAAFASESAREIGIRSPRFAPEALELLRAHEWKGNVRELRNLVERVLMFLDGDVVTAAVLTRAGLPVRV